MPPDLSPLDAARRAAVRLLVGGAAASGPAAFAAVPWLRERMRLGCEFIDGAWRCDADAPVATACVLIVVGVVLALGWVWLVLRATASAPRQRAEQLAAVSVIGALPSLALAACLLLDASLAAPPPDGLDVSRVVMWVERAMVPTLLALAASVLGYSSLRIRAAGSLPRVALVQLVAALTLALIASLVTLLGLLATSLAFAAALVAGWRIARAQGR